MFKLREVYYGSLPSSLVAAEIAKTRLVVWLDINYCETVNLLDTITVEPGKCGGRPCIRRKRMRVTDILDLLSHDEILSDYAFLEPEDILAAIAYASRLTDHVVLASE